MIPYHRLINLFGQSHPVLFRDFVRLVAGGAPIVPLASGDELGDLYCSPVSVVCADRSIWENVRQWRMYLVNSIARDGLSEGSHAESEAEDGEVVGELHFGFIVIWRGVSFLVCEDWKLR